jgi:hypothetical protein
VKRLTCAAIPSCLQADTAAVADANNGLAAAKQELVQLQLGIQQIQAQLAADHAALADIKQAQKQQNQQQLQQQQSTVPASMQGQQLGPVTVSGAASIDADVAAQLQELPLLQLRLTAVEQSLAAAVATQQPGAATTAQSRTFNNRDGSSSRGSVVEPGSGASATLFASLPAQVAAMQAQVSQLLQARAAASRTNSTARSGTTPGSSSSSNMQQQLAHHALQAAADAEDGSCAAAYGADADDSVVDTAAPADMGEAAAGAADDAGTGIAAALAELSERVVELQAQLDGLSAAKADRGELERLRGLLAETAAQVRLDTCKPKSISLRDCLTASMQHAVHFWEYNRRHFRQLAVCVCTQLFYAE